MYQTFVCRVHFDEDGRSMRYGISAGNEFEVKDAVKRTFGKVVISEIRKATRGEAASLNLTSGGIRPLN